MWQGDEPEGGTKPFGSIAEKLALAFDVDGELDEFLILIFFLFIAVFFGISEPSIIPVSDLIGARKRSGVVFLM